MLNNNIDYKTLIDDYIKDIELSDNTEKYDDALVINKFYDYSKMIRKDMFSFTYEDFVNLFEYYMWVKLSTFYNRKSIIKRFLVVCEHYGYCPDRYVYEFDKRMDENSVNKNVKFEIEFFNSFEKLYILIQKVKINMAKLGTYNFVFEECLLYLIWLGLTLDEIVDLKDSDYDYETSTLTCGLTNKTMVIKDERIKDAIESQIGLKYIIKERKNAIVQEGNKKQKIRMFIQNGKMFKSFSSEYPVTSQSLRLIITQFNKLVKSVSISDEYFSKKITYKSVRLSGIYNQIKTLEQQLNIEISLKNASIFDEKLNGMILNGLDINEPKANYSRLLIREYLSYKNYLKARE